MTTIALKKKITSLIDKTTNEKKLRLVYDVLSKETKEETAQRRVQQVVDASDRSLRAGKGLGLEELDRRSARSVKRILAGRSGKRVAAARKPIARRS